MAVLAYVLITLKSGVERDVCNRISDFEEVVSLEELYGEFDAILKVRINDLAELDDFLTEKLRVIPDVYSTSTMVVAKQYKGM